MIPLFTCRACGFLSTRRGEFKTIDGVLFDNECHEAYRMNRQPVAEWVRQKLPAPPPSCGDAA